MNLDQIEAFLYVIELGSVHQAAKVLYLSQPTITARIKSLEAELETTLFVRNNRSLVLNDNGKAFIPYARQMLQTYKQAKKELETNQECNVINIGANIISSLYFIPTILPQMAKQFPNFQVNISAGTNEQLLRQLKQQQLDVVLMRATADNDVKQIPLINNKVKLIVNKKHPLAVEKKFTIQQLQNEQLVFFECGAFDWNYIYKLFELENIHPTIYLKTDHLEIAKSLIHTNDCIGFLPELAVLRELKEKSFVEVDTKQLLAIEQNIYMTSLLNNQLNMSVKQFITEQAKLFTTYD